MYLPPRPYHIESSAPWREGWLRLTEYETSERADQCASAFSHSIFLRDATFRVVGPGGVALSAYKNSEKVEIEPPQRVA